MKKALFTLLLAHIGFSLSAQIMLDENVANIVAYWSLGDSLEYEYSYEEYIVNNEDTVIRDKYTERFQLSVIDTINSEYILQYKTIEKKQDSIFKKPDIFENMDQSLFEPFKNLPILLKTNNLGTYEGLANMDNITAAVKEIIEIIKPEILKAYPDSLGGFDMNQIYNKLIEPLLSPELLNNMVVHAVQLIRYHGLAIALNEDIHWTEQRKSPYDNSLIDVQCHAIIDEYDIEDDYIYLYNDNIFDSDQLIKSYLRYLGNVVDHEIPDNPERPYTYLEEIVNVAIHLDSGWTTNTYYKQTQMKGVETRVKEWTVNLILDEE